MALRGFRDRSHWQGFSQRFGLGPKVRGRRSIWVHAVSVGEVQASVPLVKALLASVSGGTAGADHGHRHRARARAGAVRDTCRRALRAHRPARFGAALFPARATAARGHPRDRDLAEPLSPLRPPGRAAGAGQRANLAALGEELSAAGRACFARRCHTASSSPRRASEDAERFRSIGASPRTHPRGRQHQVRFRRSARHRGAAAHELRRLLGMDRPVWVAGSTHAKEEEMLIAAHRAAARALRAGAAGAGAASSAALRRGGRTRCARRA